MSATGRTPDLRIPSDAYMTAPWAVYRLLEGVEAQMQLPVRKADGLPAYWLEPCAGNGQLIRAVNGWMSTNWPKHNGFLSGQGTVPNIRWHACEIRPECEELLKTVANPVIIGDFLSVVPATYDVVLTNPPYGLAEEFVRACLPIAKHVVMLLRLNWLEGRNDLWSTNPADVWVLPNRIPFARNKYGKVGTDATAYAWFHWYEGAEGRVRMLEPTPRAVRSAYRKYLDMTLPMRSDDDSDDGADDGEPEGTDGAVLEPAVPAARGEHAPADDDSGAASGQLAEGVAEGDGGNVARDSERAVVSQAAAEYAAADAAGPDYHGCDAYPVHRRCVGTHTCSFD